MLQDVDGERTIMLTLVEAIDIYMYEEGWENLKLVFVLPAAQTSKLP